MSADNGIYILETPRPPIKTGNMYTNQKGYDYRVAHCTAIDNIDYSDLYLPLLFGNSKVYSSHDEALKAAIEIEKEIKENGWFTEYGINTIKKNVYFPNMTADEARKALDVYVMNTIEVEDEE